MPTPNSRPTLVPLAHDPVPVMRGDRRPRPAWREAAVAALLVVGGAVLLHGAMRWQAATQVAGLVGAGRLVGHPSRAGRIYAVALVAAVVMVDVLGAAVPGLRWP